MLECRTILRSAWAAGDCMRWDGTVEDGVQFGITCHHVWVGALPTIR